MASGSPGEAGPEGERLWELLRGGWRLLDELEAPPAHQPPAQPPAQAQAQAQVQQAIARLERAAQALAQLDLFSRQEELEEVASADLRFMVLPAVLGALLLRRSGGGPEQRLQDLRRARASFADFLRLAHDYGLAPAPPPSPKHDRHPHPHPHPPQQPPPPQPSLLAMAAARQAKIQRYKQKKEKENRLAALKPFVEAGQAEEEQIREYYLLQIGRWVHTSLDEIDSIDQEIAILSRRDALQQETRAPPLRAPRPPVKPFILTRDAAQAKYSAVIELGGGASGACLVLATLEMTLRWWPLHPRPCSPCDPDSPSSVHVSMCNSDLLFFGRVFGAGYPGLATMSVDEWYEQHRKRGVLPDQGLPRAAPAGNEEQQKEPEEGPAEEEEEEESVWKAREWDDWKDMHPRGYGNRKNMG